MPGLSRPPGLSTRMRARTVRVAMFTSGSSTATVPLKVCPANAGVTTRAAAPARNAPLCASCTSAMTHTLVRLAMRNSVMPGATCMPSLAN